MKKRMSGKSRLLGSPLSRISRCSYMTHTVKLTSDDALCTPPHTHTYNSFAFSSTRVAERPGYVRARIMYQGFVVAPAADAMLTRPRTTLTWLANFDFCGSVSLSCKSGRREERGVRREE